MFTHNFGGPGSAEKLFCLSHLKLFMQLFNQPVHPAGAQLEKGLLSAPCGLSLHEAIPSFLTETLHSTGEEEARRDCHKCHLLHILLAKTCHEASLGK